MAGAHKKVIIRLFSGGTVAGYLPGGGFVEDGKVPLLDPSGKMNSFHINDIKLIAYVRDFNLGDTVEPERMGRRTFPARPRSEGLWMRMTFRDGDVLEGMAGLDLSLVEPMVQDGGLQVAPPDARSNTLRVFVPRTSLTALELLGLVTTAAQRKAATKPSREPQPGLFGES